MIAEFCCLIASRSESLPCQSTHGFVGRSSFHDVTDASPVGGNTQLSTADDDDPTFIPRQSLSEFSEGDNESSDTDGEISQNSTPQHSYHQIKTPLKTSTPRKNRTGPRVCIEV